MTLDEILKALSAHRSATADECVRAARANRVSATFPPLGKTTAREALVLYEHRRKRMLGAGIGFDGLDVLLRELATRNSDEELALAGFSGVAESYVAFLDALGTVIGCVRVEKGGERPL